MSLRKIILNLLALCLGIIGVVCGLLCLVCLIALLFWQGLGVGTVVFALLSLFCLGLAVMLSGRAAKRKSKRLGDVLRSLNTWRCPGGSGAAPALYREYDRGAYNLKLRSNISGSDRLPCGSRFPSRLSCSRSEGRVPVPPSFRLHQNREP
jgi:hypothetical protein